MAWNEPGGPKGNDPWGGRNNEQGPPDLDEVLKKMQDKFGGIFGGGSSGGSNSQRGIGAMILLVAVAIWALSGIYIVEEGKRAVVMQFGAYNDISNPGPHWFPRFVQSVEQVDVDQIRNLELGYNVGESVMLTQDENMVDIKFSVQYKVKDPKEYLFSVRDPNATLREATESAVREVVGKSTMDLVITTGRSEIAANAQRLIQEILDNYRTGLLITSVNMQKAQAPEQVQDAFADAVKAREDEQRLKNEAEAYANDVIPKARGGAARLLEEANAYKSKVIAEAEGETSRFLNVLREYERAPAVTRERLYLEAMESILANSSKVMVDVKQGNNMFYMPLDQIMKQQGTSRLIPQSQEMNPESTNFNSQESQGLRENMRNREVRR